MHPTIATILGTAAGAVSVTGVGVWLVRCTKSGSERPHPCMDAWPNCSSSSRT